MSDVSFVCFCVHDFFVGWLFRIILVKPIEKAKFWDQKYVSSKFQVVQETKFALVSFFQKLGGLTESELFRVFPFFSPKSNNRLSPKGYRIFQRGKKGGYNLVHTQKKYPQIIVEALSSFF